MKLTPRFILQPGEQARYKITFTPKTVGTYTHKYAIEAVGWPNKYYLNLQGDCDIPRIDTNPETLFSKTIQRRNNNNMYENLVFVKELGIFDFGFILLCNLDKENDEGYKTHVCLRNISLLPCNLTFTLKNNSKNFYFDPKNITVETGEVQTLDLYALPNKKGSFENELLISIKNNPVSESIKLLCTGCKIKFNVTPKSIEFHRVNLKQREVKKVRFENESGVPCVWRFEGLEEILEKFVVSNWRGKLQPMEAKEVSFEFYSEEVMTFPKTKFRVLVSCIFEVKHPVYFYIVR